MAFAVLAHAGDSGAELLAQELARRAGSASVDLVWGEELLLDSRFTHRLDSDGVVTEVALASDQALDSRRLDGVVCRLTHAETPQFAAAPEADRLYAAMEAYALLLSWLASLDCLLLNPPSPRGLAGPQPDLFELTPLAAACGLPRRRLRLGAAPGGQPQPWLEPLAREPVEVLVAGDRVLGPVGGAEAAACAELARRLGCPLLGGQLGEPAGRDAEGLVLCGVETVPGLDPEGVAAVADLLLGEAA